MPETPILSYKKPSSQAGTAPSTPIIPSPGASQHSPPKHSSRKVLSRRKALQEFYNIQQQQEKEIQSTNKSVGNESQRERKLSESGKLATKPDLSIATLTDTDALASFTKTSTIEEILKLRNSITNKLNSHDLAKKSIIYDNYYELIRLSDTLDSLVTSTSTESGEKSAIGENQSLSVTNEPESISLEAIFEDLHSFLTTESAKFEKPFETVISTLRQDISELTESDSRASIIGITEENGFPEDIDKEELAKEVGVLLDGEVAETQSIVDDIQKVLTKLNVQKDGLLILQLNEVKKKLLARS
jgi:hypothetical protein